LLRGRGRTDGQVVDAKAAAVAEPSGGAVFDVEALAAIDQILSTFQGHCLIHD